MALQTRPFDPAEFMEDDEDYEFYLQESLKIALEDNDPSFLTRALGTVARARGMTELAKNSGLSRESLYKSLSPAGNPEFATVLRVIQALGFKLSIEKKESEDAVA
jgi:probable addiction module antidote protein